MFISQVLNLQGRLEKLLKQPELKSATILSRLSNFFQWLQCEDLPLFSISYNRKLNILGMFLLIGQNKQFGDILQTKQTNNQEMNRKIKLIMKTIVSCTLTRESDWVSNFNTFLTEMYQHQRSNARFWYQSIWSDS